MSGEIKYLRVPPPPNPVISVSEEAKEITKWARENKLGYVHASVLEEFAQRAINSATEKLTTELKDQHSKQVELIRQLETSQAAVGENCKTIEGLTKENKALKELLNRERDIPRDKDIPIMTKNIQFLFSENKKLTKENEGLKSWRQPYCAIHKTWPFDDEPCWQCVNQFHRKGYEEGKTEIQTLSTRIKELENEVARLNGQTNYEL